MSGINEVSHYFIPAAACVAVVTDLARGRIFNWLTIPLFFLGLIYSTATAGWSGLGLGLAGALAGLALFGWLFAIRVMGGGDVKFLMAMGAWGGPAYCLEVALLSILVGGAMAFVLLLVQGRLPGFLRRMHIFLLSIIVRELELQRPELDRKLTMPFGIPIAVAAVWTLFAHPVRSWGVLPWL